jgi:hypothetical protein
MMDIKEVELELFAQQSEIIQIYSAAVNELIHLLHLHNVDDSEFKGVKEKIDQAAAVRAEYSL